MGDYPLVFIEWIDSYAVNPEWVEIEDVKPEPLSCYSVGWVVGENESCVVVVPHMSDKHHNHARHQGCGDMTIPKCAIIRRVELTHG